MDNSVKITFIICATLVVLISGGYILFSQVNPSSTISVNGMSEVTVIPDNVVIYFYIETEAETAEEAKDLNAEIYDDFLLGLIKEGIDSDEVQTQSYSVNPVYDWDDYREIIGYRAYHRIKIELPVEDSDEIGDIIDAGVDAGALVSYLNFELSIDKQNEYKAQAIEQAAEDARIKAEAMAEGLGKRVGRVISISSSDFDYYPWKFYEVGAGEDVVALKEATTNIQPSEQSVAARVSVTYSII